ncbi:RNA polymerase sigma factor [Amycolatopsis sp. lyj-108]|uniref:RNA polymerase sigma factor n=1 Tax=Amycolatopsis sp. lyj-108 TaxID=2789286 RepID=UPI00397A0A8B
MTPPEDPLLKWKRIVCAIGQYLPDMYAACFMIVKNVHDAWDATQSAVEKVLKKAPGKDVKDVRAWLCMVAINSARDLLRKRQASGGDMWREIEDSADPRADFLRTTRLRLDMLKFLDRVWRFLDKTLHEDVVLHLEVALKLSTEAELAEQLGVRLNEVRNRRRRGAKALRDAATVTVLVTDPGEGPNRCVIPRCLAERKEDSPELLREVRTHIGACKRCGRRRDDRTALMRIILAVPGLAMAGDLLNRFLPTVKYKVAAATAAAVVISIPLLPHPDAGEALPAGPISGPASTPVEVPVPLPPPPPRPGPIDQPSAPSAVTGDPASATRTNVPPAAAVPPAADGNGVQDTGLSVTDSWVQHRRIAAADSGTCGSEPTSSTVRVTVSPGAKSALILVTVPGSTFSLPMEGTAEGTRWTGQVGPIYNEDARASLGIAVEIVGSGGARMVKDLGKIDVFPC